MTDLYKTLGIKWECLRHNKEYKKDCDDYFSKLKRLPVNISEGRMQDFKNKAYELFRQKYSLNCPVDYRISYFELEDALRCKNIKRILEKESKDLIKDEGLMNEYLKSKYSINTLPIQKYKATIFQSLKSVLRNGLFIERSSRKSDMPIPVFLGSSIGDVAYRGNLLTITINLDHTVTQITDHIKKLLISLDKRFKKERKRWGADEDCLRVYNLKEKEKSWREIMGMQKANSGEDHDRLRQLKRQYAKAKKLIANIFTK